MTISHIVHFDLQDFSEPGGSKEVADEENKELISANPPEVLPSKSATLLPPQVFLDSHAVLKALAKSHPWLVLVRGRL